MKLISAAFDLGVGKGGQGEGAEEVIFSPEHTAYFYTFFYSTPVSESQETELLMQGSRKSLN